MERIIVSAAKSRRRSRRLNMSGQPQENGEARGPISYRLPDFDRLLVRQQQPLTTTAATTAAERGVTRWHHFLIITHHISSGVGHDGVLICVVRSTENNDMTTAPQVHSDLFIEVEGYSNMQLL